MQRSDFSTTLSPTLKIKNITTPIESYNVVNWLPQPEDKSKSYLDISFWITTSCNSSSDTTINVHNQESKKEFSLSVEKDYKIYQLLSGNRLGIIYSDRVDIINLHTGQLDCSIQIHKDAQSNITACGLHKASVSINNKYLLICFSELSDNKRTYIAIIDIDTGESISIETGKDNISDFTLTKSNQLLVISHPHELLVIPHPHVKFECDLTVFDFNMATKAFTESTVVIAPFIKTTPTKYTQILGGWDNPYITLRAKNTKSNQIDFSLYQLEQSEESYQLRKVKSIDKQDSKEYWNLWGIPIANSLVYLNYSSSIMKLMEFNFNTLASQELILPNVKFDFQDSIPEVFGDSQLVVKIFPRPGDAFQFVKLNLASVLSYIKEYRNEEGLEKKLYQMKEIEQLPTALIKIISEYTLSNNKIRFFPSCSIEEKAKEEFNPALTVRRQ